MTYRKPVIVDKKGFILWLKRARRFKNMTIRDIERVSGVPNSSVTNMEVGKSEVSMETCFRIAKALGYNIILVDVISKYGMESDPIRNKKHLGMWLKEIRKRRGYLQGDVARIGNLNKSYLYHIENGVRFGSQKRFFRLLNALGYGIYMEERRG